jgi:hypothetical protein
MRAAGLELSEVRDGLKDGTKIFTVRGGSVPTLVLRDPARE